MKALVEGRSKAVSLPHGDLVLSGVPTLINLNLSILSFRFDCKLMCVVLCHMSSRKLVS